jgi:hypothetical protein
MKSEKMELPSSIDQIVTQFAQLMSNSVNKIVVDVDAGSIDVIWTPVTKDEVLLSDISSIDIKEVFDRVRITDYSNEIISYDPVALATIMSAIQEMTSERVFAYMIICRSINELKKYLGLPKALPLTAFAGIPVIERPDFVVEECVYILGAKFYGATPKATCAIRLVSLNHTSTEE